MSNGPWIISLDMGPLPRRMREEKTEFKTSRYNLIYIWYCVQIWKLLSWHLILVSWGKGTSKSSGKKQFTGEKNALKKTQSPTKFFQLFIPTFTHFITTRGVVRWLPKVLHPWVLQEVDGLLPGSCYCTTFPPQSWRNWLGGNWPNDFLRNEVGWPLHRCRAAKGMEIHFQQ